MPATSKAQFRFMQGVAGGSIKPPSGLSKGKAAEFVPQGSAEKQVGRGKVGERSLKAHLLWTGSHEE